jgi:molybdate transport system regulatory protein
MGMTQEKKIDATLALRSEGKLLVGRDRIKVLEAVAKHRSISKAAKAAGFSYKAAWDAVTAINNLLPSPAFVTKAGGRDGGGAEVTAEGLKLIEAFHAMEARLSEISTAIAADGMESADGFLFGSLNFKFSARNVFRAEVAGVAAGPVEVEVALSIAGDRLIHAVVTNESARELELAPGRKALVLVKAPFVEIAPPSKAARGERNCFQGVTMSRVDGEKRSEIVIDIGDGKTLAAVAPRSRADELGVEEGVPLCARFAAEEVILAVS